MTVDYKFLTNNAAVEVLNIDIKKISQEEVFEIRNILLNHLVVVIRNQDRSPAILTHFIERMGCINEYDELLWDTSGNWLGEMKSYKSPLSFEDPDSYPVQRVTGQVVDGKVSGIFGTGILDWHSDLNRYDIGDGVALQAYSGVKNSSTIFLNTKLARDALSSCDLENLSEAYCEYTFSPDIWCPGIPEHQMRYMLNSPAGIEKHYKMWLLQKNAAGTEGIYFFKNNRCIMRTKNGIDDSIRKSFEHHFFQEQFMYEHFWQEGDIVLSDQLLTLHKRGQDDQDLLKKRVLNRICFQLSNKDGFIRRANTIPSMSVNFEDLKVMKAPDDLKNDSIYGFDYDFDRSLLYTEFRKRFGDAEKFSDSGIPESVTKLKVIESLDFPYISEIKRAFNIEGEARFYWLQGGQNFDLHVDTLPQCSLNVLLSENNAPVYVNGSMYSYQNCILNVKKPHGVFGSSEDRILFKISIFSKSFEEVRNLFHKKVMSEI